jgi:hypothetical protein
MRETEYDWARTVYGRVKKELPTNAPKPLGKPVVMTTYVDANLYHGDIMTGGSVSAVFYISSTKHQLNGSQRYKLQWKLQCMDQNSSLQNWQYNKSSGYVSIYGT